MLLLLKSIRNKFIRSRDKEIYASELIWEGVITYHQYQEESQKQDGHHINELNNQNMTPLSISTIIDEMLQVMKVTLRLTTVQKVYNVVSSWSDLFPLLDVSYTSCCLLTQSTSALSSKITGSGLYVKGVPELWNNLVDVQHKHKQLIVLLQEVIQLLDSAHDGASSQSLEELKKNNSPLLVEVDLLPDNSSESDIMQQEADVIELLDNLLHEVYEWTHDLTMLIVTHSHPEPLLGIMTLNFTPPSSTTSETLDDNKEQPPMNMNIRSR